MQTKLRKPKGRPRNRPSTTNTTNTTNTTASKKRSKQHINATSNNNRKVINKPSNNENTCATNANITTSVASDSASNTGNQKKDITPSTSPSTSPLQIEIVTEKSKRQVKTMHLNDNSLARLCKNFLTPDKAQLLYDHLINDITFSESTISLKNGREIVIPRLQAWMADPTLDRIAYLYSDQPANNWTPLMFEVKCQLEEMLNFRFDYCLINYYRNGKDSIAWHADKEALPDDKNKIASISLGATRKFILRHIKYKELNIKPIEFRLTSGCLITMEEDTQKHWLHSVPKQHTITEGRINLTFRKA